MRKIKFRALKLRTKEFIYGSLMSDDKQGVAMIQQRANPVNYGNASGWCFGVDPESVGQFTELQDKNGVDIYEGDYICLDGLKTHRWEICYRGSGFIASPLSGNSIIEYRTLQNNNYLQFEVIGNIHTTKL